LDININYPTFLAPKNTFGGTLSSLNSQENEHLYDVKFKIGNFLPSNEFDFIAFANAITTL
jgi:hypothetical protein